MPYDYDVDRNRVYLEGSFGVNDSLEAFGRVGGSNWVVNDVESWQPGKRHDLASEGYPAFFSGGLRGKLWEWDDWSLGASFEAALYAGMDRSIRWNYNIYQTLRFDPPLEFNLGLSIGRDCGLGTLYFGSLLHYAYTSVDVRTNEFGPNWQVEDHIDALTIRDKAGWGAFVGWQMPLGDDGWNLQLEGSALRGGFGFAISFFKGSPRTVGAVEFAAPASEPSP
jgi:hypothetical protein